MTASSKWPHGLAKFTGSGHIADGWHTDIRNGWAERRSYRTLDGEIVGTVDAVAEGEWTASNHPDVTYPDRRTAADAWEEQATWTNKKS